MASAVGVAVLDAIEEDKCQTASKTVGTYFLERLGAMRENYSTIGDVRGKGLMIGIEMVEDKVSKTPMSAERLGEVWNLCKDMGVLLGKGGLNGHVLRIKPPMCITKEDVDFALDVLGVALDKCGMRGQ